VQPTEMTLPLELRMSRWTANPDVALPVRVLAQSRRAGGTHRCCGDLPPARCSYPPFV
jgi:hypothetical protein